MPSLTRTNRSRSAGGSCWVRPTSRTAPVAGSVSTRRHTPSWASSRARASGIGPWPARCAGSPPRPSRVPAGTVTRICGRCRRAGPGPHGPVVAAGGRAPPGRDSHPSPGGTRPPSALTRSSATSAPAPLPPDPPTAAQAIRTRASARHWSSVRPLPRGRPPRPGGRAHAARAASAAYTRWASGADSSARSSAIPSSNGLTHTRRSLRAAASRASAPAGSALSTSRASAARTCGAVCPGARPSACASTCVGRAGHPRPRRQRAHRRGDRLRPHPVDAAPRAAPPAPPGAPRSPGSRRRAPAPPATTAAAPRRPRAPATSMAPPANDAGPPPAPGATTSATSSAWRACSPRHQPLGGRQRLHQRLAVRRADVEPGQRGTQIRPRHTFEHVFDLYGKPMPRQEFFAHWG